MADWKITEIRWETLTREEAVKELGEELVAKWEREQQLELYRNMDYVPQNPYSKMMGFIRRMY